MQFKKLRLSGFKSFVRPTELLIEAGLTGIVGPNGCGKSNVVEALRWAMGESSARGLRGSEMDDVIFAGTGARPPYDLAEVALQLEADGIRIPGFEQDGEFELIRRIARGTGSSFRLNGRELRARDVQLLFADAASGARSAAIVSQGQIGALVEAKPQDRRRLLEDAAGVAGLQARRHEAELKLRAAEANLVRLDDLLQTLQEQHDQLKKQARQAKRYAEIGARLRDVGTRLAIGRWLRAVAEFDDMRDRLRKAEIDAEGAAGNLDRLRASRTATAATLAKRRDELALLRTERARLAERVEAEERAREARRAQLARAREQVDELERDRTDAERLLGDGQAATMRLTSELGELAPQLDALARQREAAHDALGRLEAEADEVNRTYRSALARHGDVEARCRHVREERARLDEEGQALERRRQELAAAPAPDEPPVDQAASRLEASLLDLTTAEAAAADADGEVAASDRARDEVRDALRRAQETLTETAQALRDAEHAVEQKRQARAALTHRTNELDDRLQRLETTATELNDRRAERLRALEDLHVDALEEAGVQADDAFIRAASSFEAAEAAFDEATHRLQTADAEARDVTAEIERLEAEAAALREIGTADLCPPVLERITAPDDLNAALAAGLGDDLLASLDAAAPLHWAGSSFQSEADLPTGARRLADLVEAPPALMPRLRQIGLCAAADGPQLQGSLAQGQRLVSKDGDLWRWDGFTRRADALSSVAARLRQHRRRRDLEALLASRRERLRAIEVERDAAAAAADDARAHQASSAEAKTAAELHKQQAARRHSEASASGRAFAIEIEGLGDALGRTEAEMDEVRAVRSRLEIELAQGRDEETRVPVELQQARGQAGSAHAEATAAERAAAERQDVARRRLAERRAAVERCRHEVDEARRAAHAAEAAALERRHAAERHAHELDLLAEGRDALQRRRADLEAALATLTRETEEARAALAAAEAAQDRLKAAQTAALAEHSALDARHQAAVQQRARLEDDLKLWQTREAEARERVAKIAARELIARDQLRSATASAGSEDEAKDPPANELETLDRRVEAAEAAVREVETAQGELERQLEAADGERSATRERVIRLEAEVERLDGVRNAAEADLRARPLPQDLEVDEEVPEPSALAALDDERARLEVARERLGAVNLRAVEELRELEIRQQTLSAERDELSSAIERLHRAIGALNREGRQRLKVAFAEIEKHFEALFVRLFGGGQARLSLTDLEDPLAAGLELAASPPGKKLQSLSLLSGGEKALTALSLIFAVFLSRPAPLCILDEVDAPLDDANVERFAALLDELAAGTETRFIVVTHHPLTMAHMDRLYGVTMLERGVSELISVDLGRAIELRRTA